MLLSLISRQQKIHTGGRSLLCPHRSCTVIQIDRISPEVSLSQICFIALCNCYTFCQILLAPYLCFNVIFQHFFTFTPIKEQVHLGESTSWLHISSRPVCKKYSVVKVQDAYAAISEWKGTMLTACYATSKANIFVISFVSNLRRRVSSMQ